MDTSISFEFHVPTRIIFKSGSLAELTSLPELRERQCMLFTRSGFDRNLACGLLDSIAKSVVVVEESEENPTIETCQRIAERARSQDIDAVVAIGGGSCIDMAKAVAFFRANPEWNSTEHVEETPASMIIVAVPTTSGTGSEVSPYTVLTDSRTHAKAWIRHDSLIPHVAICDPDLTATMPRGVTANTGIDALSHAVEGYLSQLCNGLLEPIALDACRRVQSGLPTALDSPDDRSVRESLMLAALEGGFVLSACGTVFVHALGYRLTQAFGYTHGLANGLMLGAFVERFADIGSERAKRLLELFGGSITEFVQSVGITPDRSIDSVDESKFEDWVESGWKAYGRKNAIVEVQKEDVRAILKSAFIS